MVFIYIYRNRASEKFRGFREFVQRRSSILKRQSYAQWRDWHAHAYSFVISFAVGAFVKAVREKPPSQQWQQQVG